MFESSTPTTAAAEQLAATTRIAGEAKRATRWFRWFAIVQALFALSFTLSVDVAGTPYWPAFLVLGLATGSLWFKAVLLRHSAPRYGLRNMGIAMATWFALYTLMLDPALQLFGLSSPWWWVLAGVIAASPIAACAFSSSRV